MRITKAPRNGRRALNVLSALIAESPGLARTTAPCSTPLAMLQSPEGMERAESSYG